MDSLDTPKPFDLDDIDAADEANMTVMSNGKPTDWTWAFCGPGHPQAIAQSNRIARDALNRNRLKEMSVTNGKKWKAPDQSPDELLEDNVNFVLERLLRWSDVTMADEPYPYSQENARKLLMNRRKGALLQQAIDFVLDDNSFTKRSAKA